MVPVTTTQRELSPEVQKNYKLLTGQNFPLEARQIGAAGMLQQGSAAIATLRQVLCSQPAPIVVQAVAQAIPEVKDPPAELIDPLIQQLSADEAEVRNAVVAALISYRDHDVPAKLRTVASNMQNSQPARLAGVAVLSQLADRDSIETLIELLETPDDMVRQSSLNALGQMTGVNFGFEVARWRSWWLANRNRRPQEWAAGVIASLTEEKRSALDEVKALRAQLAKAQRELYYLSPELDRPKRIKDCLTSPVAEVRLVGVDLVNMLIPTMDRKSIAPEVAEQLRKLIDDPDMQVRLQTVRVLGDLRNSEDAKLLLDALNKETDPAVSQAITRALGLLHNTAAVPVLLGQLIKDDGPLAAAAAAGLSVLCQKSDRIVSTQQLDQVVTALKARMESATDKALRQAILDAMARIADGRFREQFLAALQSQDPALRQSAVNAFADLNGPEDAEKVLAQLADNEAVVREAACAALGKIGKAPQLALLLQHCDEQAESNLAVRRAAEDAAVAVLLHMDRPALRTHLEQLAAAPGQTAVLGAVLEKAEKARAQLAGQNPDNALQAILLRCLAATKATAGLKDDAAKAWVQVVLLEPTDAAATGALARVLVELGKTDAIVSAVKQVATGPSSALAGVLAAIGKELQAARSGGRSADLAEALRKIDTSSWSQSHQETLRVFLETCEPATGAPAASSAPAVVPTGAARTGVSAPATAPVTMAHRAGSQR